MSVSCERREVLFSGVVQGVGFRYTTRRIAQRHRVGGYVQNLSDGRVRAVIEGPADEIDRFLGAIRAELGDYISQVEQQTQAPVGEPSEFEIRF